MSSFLYTLTVSLVFKLGVEPEVVTLKGMLFEAPAAAPFEALAVTLADVDEDDEADSMVAVSAE